MSERLGDSAIPGLESVNVVASVEAMGEMAGPAYSALQFYGERVHDAAGRTVRHPVKVATLTHDFGDEFMDPRVRDVTLLQDIGSRIKDDIVGKNARAALALYSRHPDISQHDWEFVSSLLVDQEEIEKHVTAVRSDTQQESQELFGALTSTHGYDEIPTWMWNMRPYTSTASKLKMFELAENVNIESLLTSSAEMLDNLKHPAPRGAAVLQDIFDVETFYAPMCGVLGYLGLAMALRDQLYRIKLTRGGHGGSLEAASAMLEPFNDRNLIAGVIGGTFTNMFGGTSLVQHAITNEAQHDIIIGESLLQSEVFGGSGLMRAMWRLKTKGSTGEKIDSGKPLTDLAAGTLIGNDIEQAGAAFGRLRQQVALDIEAGRLAESDKSKPLEVRGSKEFIGNILEIVGMSEKSEPLLKTSETENDYQVAKRTYKIPIVRGELDLQLPMEVQIQTEEDRLRSRAGRASHDIGYKGEKPGVPIDDALLEAVARLRARKEAMPTTRGELVAGSLERSADTRALIKRTRIPSPRSVHHKSHTARR